MILNVKGDLLKSGMDVLAHQSNCKMGFGSGIAGQIRAVFPYAYEAFMNDKRKPHEKLGTFSLGHHFQGPMIFNLYGQMDYGREKKVYTDYDALESAFEMMMDYVINFEKEKRISVTIGIPKYMGCGLAGGDWSIVEEIIDKLTDKYYHTIYIYELV